jgi:hypothetical protein
MKKNITFSAESDLIQQARERAEKEDTSLNAEFRRWLEKYAQRTRLAQDFSNLMEKFEYVQAGRFFSREEMNER